MVSVILPHATTMPNFLNDFEPNDTQTLLLSDDSLKHKIVDVLDEKTSSDFLDELNRGGLTLPSFSTVYFVHSAFRLFEKLSSDRCRWRF